MRSWLEVFPLLLETRIARSAAEVRQAQHARFVAYCEDKAYLDPADYPEEIETDEDDARAQHALVRFRPTGALLGSVRLILPPGRFPMERVTGQQLGRLLPDADRSCIAEISRLCMTRRYVRSDLAFSVGPEGRRALQLAILALFRGVIALSRAHGITHWCAMMSPAVLRGSRRLGVHLQEVGPSVRFFGTKQPVLGIIDHVLETMRKERPDLFELALEPL